MVNSKKNGSAKTKVSASIKKDILKKPLTAQTTATALPPSIITIKTFWIKNWWIIVLSLFLTFGVPIWHSIYYRKMECETLVSIALGLIALLIGPYAQYKHTFKTVHN